MTGMEQRLWNMFVRAVEFSHAQDEEIKRVKRSKRMYKRLYKELVEKVQDLKREVKWLQTCP
jgi:hypothetical protein